MLKELDLSYPYPSGCKNYTNYVDGVEALSLALIKLQKVNLSGFPINNQSLCHLFINCKYLEEVIIFYCHEITSAGLATALRERPTLSYLSFSSYGVHEVLPTSLVSLKGLTSLDLRRLIISDELLYSIAREGLPLTRFVLVRCRGHNYAGIICLLSSCQRIQHLVLKYTDFLVDQHVLEFSAFLVDLVSINLSYCRRLTKSALFTLAKNSPSLSKIKMENIGRKILLDLESCDHISEGICQVLRKCCKIRNLNLTCCSRVKLLGMNFVVPNLEVLNLSWSKTCVRKMQTTEKDYKVMGGIHINDKNRKLFSRHGCRIHY
ncbi:F-box/LRR-repeat protein [Trifolium repens]|nr:F-box/LRR-repeat protein [Trifolium repens]